MTAIDSSQNNAQLNRPTAIRGLVSEREFGRRIKSRMVQLVPDRNARPPAKRSPLMQALHVKAGEHHA